MYELKIVIENKMFTSNITTNIVLPLFLDYDGTYFPNEQWTDFTDILNMWTYKLLGHISEDESKFTYISWMDLTGWMLQKTKK